MGTHRQGPWSRLHPRARWAAVATGALLAAGCGAGGGLSRPVDAVPMGGGFAGVALGQQAELGPPRFSPAEGRAGTFLLAEGQASIGGEPMDSVSFRVDADGRLAAIELVASTDEGAREDRLEALARAICDALGAQVESYTPSPLGTPEPGEEESWDPVHTDNEECEGVDGGVRVSIHAQRNHASDFSRVDLLVRLSAPD